MARDWSSLQHDILTSIAMKMGALEDFIYFSVVCRWWNHVSSLVKNDWRPVPAVPWLLLSENPEDNPDCFRKIYNLKNNKCYQLSLPETFGKKCWGSAYGWIAMVDREFDVKLFNPITKAQISFPSLKMHPERPRYEERDYRSREEYTTWCMRFFARLIVLNVPQRSGRREFIIVVLSTNMLSTVFARHGDQSWTPIFIKKHEEYNILDVVDMGDYAYALLDDQSVAYFDFNETPNLEQDDGSIVYLRFVEAPSCKFAKPLSYSQRIDMTMLERLQINLGFRNKFLVQSGSDLLMVLRWQNTSRIGNRTNCFGVFKLDPKNKSWEEIIDYGDVALLVGCNYSVCVSTVEAKYLQRSRVYFTEEKSEWRINVTEGGGHVLRVSNAINNDLRQQFNEGDETQSNFNRPIWFIPKF